jgi:hypothetical protein
MSRCRTFAWENCEKTSSQVGVVLVVAAVQRSGDLALVAGGVLALGHRRDLGQYVGTIAWFVGYRGGSSSSLCGRGRSRR